MPPEVLIPVRLAKEGFGTPEQVQNMRADLVLAALQFSDFRSDYESAYVALNKETPK